MRPPHRSFAAAAVVVTLLLVCSSAPLVAQETARGWTFIAGGGYAASLSVAASALHARSRTLSLGIVPGNGRIGIGAVERLRGAALPKGDGLLAVGFASLQARVTVR